MKRFLGIVGVAGVLVLGWANFAFCGIVTVTGTDTVFTTIQEGVNACPVGGTVSVSDGTYPEAVYINKGIALVGVGTPTITASGINNTNTVTFNGTATNNASIYGFIITGATGNWPNGMGIYCTNGSPTINYNTISGNDNGILCNYSSPTINHNTISGNTYGINCNSSSPTINYNTISGNDNGILCDYSSPFITNNIISGNSYGIYCNSSSPFITNNTISGNDNGILCNSSSPLITNNIITENGTTSADYYGIYGTSNSTLTIDYNCVWGNGSGGNNNYFNCSHKGNDISANPQFIGGADFHLNPTSPCIDAGSNTAPAIPSTDKDGKPRIINSIVDMGAYEYQDTSIFASDNNNVKVYPNPYKKGDPRFGGDYIYFGQVSQGAVIKIYNIAGELIKEVDEIDVVKCCQKWNISQENIASGVYIYTVTGGKGGKSVGKIGIIK